MHKEILCREKQKTYLAAIFTMAMAMNKKTLNRLYPIIIILLVFLVWKMRQNDAPSNALWVKINGTTMGTIQYNITYQHKTGTNFQTEIDSLLKVWNQSLSTYIPTSEISQFNQDSCLTFSSPYFLPVLKKSKEVYQRTNGAFDPTVGPLVNAWGFGPEDRKDPDSMVVDSILRYVGFEKISFDEQKVCKSRRGVQLDFSAIAKGYAVDVVARWIEDQQVKNYLVEIGGELRCAGYNQDGDTWRTGIESPAVDIMERELFAITHISDRSVATSGNYRNYYEKDGRTYTHTIDPDTGYPVQRDILSASVFADDCITADAYATAFMVLGLKKSQEMLKDNPTIEAFLLYNDANNQLQYFSTEGIKDKIELLHDE